MIVSVIAGAMLGVITGLIPGLGLFTGLILVYPFLQNLDVSNLLVFYISMAAASQYTGSVSAIVLQIPGEANSIFALRESKILALQGKIPEALGAAAVGSLAGGVGAIAITITLLQVLEPIVPYFFRSDLKAIMLVCSICLFVYFSDNKFYVNLILATSGMGLGIIGVSPQGIERTFGIDSLIVGIPWFPLLLGVMVIPKIWMETNPIITNQTSAKFCWNTGTVLRSTFAGYIGGLIPGISYLMGSKLAWLIENKISGDPLKKLLAAETANNTSAYSMLIPLLILGVPIVSSEVIIQELAYAKHFLFNWKTTIESGWFASTILPIIFVNIAVCLISFFTIKWLIIWRSLPYLRTILTLLLLVSFYFVSNNILFESLVLGFFLTFGYILRHKDVTPLIVSFLLVDQLEQNATRLLVIYGFM